MIAALAGGVGAARFLRGLSDVVSPEQIHVVVNTGDDLVLHGLHVSPDVDTVTYTLAGASNDETGWGLAGETWRVMEALDRLGGESWFRLGDRDLATHLYRTQRLSEGATLSSVTSELAASWGLRCHLVPMTDDPVRTRLTLTGGEDVDFQDYFVRRRHEVAVSSVRFEGVEASRPAPGVLASLRQADVVVLCPSNPIVSISPVLAVPGVEDTISARRDTVVAVSPIVAGAALKGPGDRLLGELGYEVSVAGVARLYAPLAATLVVDQADVGMTRAVEAEGVRCVVAPAIMSSPQLTAELARRVVAAPGGR